MKVVWTMEAVYFNGTCFMQLRFDSQLSGDLPSLRGPEQFFLGGSSARTTNLCRQIVLPVYTPPEDP